ncbi:hypothetical protein GGS21DRAFT_410431 [Xylaria nigripes]|nr:hypothetical protein GGS21DRAFT_410431 [Xylaria nigripes]
MASAPGTPLTSAVGASLNTAEIGSTNPTMQPFFHSHADSTGHVGDHSGGSALSHMPTWNEEEGATDHLDQENVASRKSRQSCIISGSGLSPLKILASQDNPNAEARSSNPNRASIGQSPRKWCPDRRFPVKINSTTTPEKPTAQQRETTTEIIVDHKDPENAIKIFEDEDTLMEHLQTEGNDTYMSMGPEENLEDLEQAGPDDTMTSTFSTFSAVPNLTMFARIGHTPTKFANVGATPTAHSGLDRSAQQVPRPTARHESENSTNLLDFTEQIQSFSSRYTEQISNLRRGSPGKPSDATFSATPRRSTDLLDFDIPPLPTPRSIPTITPRELESLKSGFLSEISSLKASLSGKEAEVISLKSAVADAEKRVGVCMEELREVKAIKEGLIEQQEIWEQRGRDMESVLRNVKEEIVRSQLERDQLDSKFEESEKRREAAEIMAQEAESKMAAMRAGKAGADSPSNANVKSPEKNKVPGSREIEIAVEKVSRELHALYKSKHESKITALKKSYENRWSKRVYELETKAEELVEENEKLRADRDVTITKVDPNQTFIDEELKAQAIRDSTQIKELNAEIEKFEAVIASVQSDNQELRLLLEKERIEKGELVQLAEEMMAMQSLCQTEAPPPPTPAAKPQPAPTENFRNSIGRGTGIRPPSTIKKPSESRIGGVGNERKIGGGLPRPPSGMGSRSGIMSSIEKMGNYRGRGD